MLPWFCSIIDNTRRQNVVRLICETLGCPLCTTYFLPRFDFIEDLLQSRRKATWKCVFADQVYPLLEKLVTQLNTCSSGRHSMSGFLIDWKIPGVSRPQFKSTLSPYPFLTYKLFRFCQFLDRRFCSGESKIIALHLWN